MRIYRPRGITRGQIVLVTVLGVIGGVYIWKPLLIEKFPELAKKTEKSAKENPTSQ